MNMWKFIYSCIHVQGLLQKDQFVLNVRITHTHTHTGMNEHTEGVWCVVLCVFVSR